MKCITLLESSFRVAALLAIVTPAIAIGKHAPLRTPSLARPISASAPASQPTSACQPDWLATFGGHQLGTSSFMQALSVFDDGGGPALYAAGACTEIGGFQASCIAKWNGSA